jgi:hypothetical protein
VPTGGRAVDRVIGFVLSACGAFQPIRFADQLVQLVATTGIAEQ